MCEWILPEVILILSRSLAGPILQVKLEYSKKMSFFRI